MSEKTEDKHDHKDRKLLNNLLVAMFVSLTVWFFAPSHIYLMNSLEFVDSSYLEIAFTLLVAAGISTVMLWIVLLPIVRRAIHFRVVAVLFVLGCLMWLQSNIMVWDYGIFDGRNIDWISKMGYGIIDSIVWLLAIVLAMAKPRLFYKAARYGCIYLIILQAVSLSFTYSQAPEKTWSGFTTQNDSMWDFSSKRNVIVIVLDGFQSDIFSEIVAEETEYNDVFDGFTYFPNAVGGFPYTYPSIPLMLTGQYYDNSIPVQDFIKDAYLETSIPRVLKDNGFHTWISKEKYFYIKPEIGSNVVQRSKSFFSIHNTRPLFDISFFRLSPHFLKQAISQRISFKPNSLITQGSSGRGRPTDTRPPKRTLTPEELHRPTTPYVPRTYPAGDHPFDTRDLRFMESMLANINVRTDQDVFKFLWTVGLHIPITLNERLEYETLPFTRENLKRQGRGCLQITRRFIEKLKEIGIYDNSIIVILADHGRGHPEKTCETTANGNMAYLAPLILVKPFKARGALKKTDAPVTIADLPRTVFDELGIKADATGQSMLNLPEATSRERKYYYCRHERQAWTKLHMPDLHEYIVDGHSWEPGSWHRTGRTMTPNGARQEVLNNAYEYGQEIRFGDGGNAEKFLKYGWNSPGQGVGTWTAGKNARIHMSVKPPESDLVLKAKLHPFLVKDKLDTQRIIVSVNGEQVGKWTVDKPGDYEMVIPRKSVGSDSRLLFSLSFPDANVPKKLGVNSDTRALSARWERLEILKAN